MKKKGNEICNYCHKDIILSKDKYVLIGTYEGEHILEENYFHWDCFILWYNSRVKEKAENIVKSMQKEVMGSVGSLLSQSPLANVFKQTKTFQIGEDKDGR